MPHRHTERHKTEHIGWLRAAVLGANDGIVSTASLIIGVAAGAVVVLLWYGANTVISGSMSPGTLSQFLIYAILAASSLGQLSEVWGEVQLAAGAAERISELRHCETFGVCL